MRAPAAAARTQRLPDEGLAHALAPRRLVDDHVLDPRPHARGDAEQHQREEPVDPAAVPVGRGPTRSTVAGEADDRGHLVAASAPAPPGQLRHQPVHGLDHLGRDLGDLLDPTATRRRAQSGVGDRLGGGGPS